MKSVKRITSKIAGWEPRIDSIKPNTKFKGKRRLRKATRRALAEELMQIGEEENPYGTD